MTIQDKYNWMGAMVEEMESLKKNETYDLVRLPQGNEVIGCKWVYKIKQQ